MFFRMKGAANLENNRLENEEVLRAGAVRIVQIHLVPHLEASLHLRCMAERIGATHTHTPPRYTLHARDKEATEKLAHRDRHTHQKKVDVRLPGKGHKNIPCREAGPPNHHHDEVDLGQ